MKVGSIIPNKILSSKFGPWFLMGGLLLVYLWLKSDSIMDLRPGYIFDDELQLNLAMSISNGNWLGGYDIATLAKGVAYPLWMSLLHVLDIPLWLGNAILYGLACFLIIYAIRHLFVKRWLLIPFFSLLLFNPLIAERTQRDSIAPALMILILAWILGYFLVSYYKETIDSSVVRRDKSIFTVVGLISLPMWCFLREDYWWIFPFLGVAIASTLIIIWLKSKSIKCLLKNTFYLALPFLSFALTFLVIGLINNHYYGKFIVNDYTSGEFTKAYGSLTRIKNDNWKPTVPVSEQMREVAYEVSPAFAELKPCLDGESNSFCAGFKGIGEPSARGDYQGGWFFWVMRAAASKAGHYKDPDSSEKFYARIAYEVNQACSSGRLECTTGERSGLHPPFRSEIVKPIVKEIIPTVGYVAAFKDDSKEMVSDFGLLTTYDPKREAIANYIGSTYNVEQLNFTKKLKLYGQKLLFFVYQVLSPILFFLTVGAFILGAAMMKRMKYKYWLELFIALGFLGLLLTRVVIIDYVSYTSFNAVYALYLSSLYPVVLLFYIIILGKIVDIILSGASKSIFKDPRRVR